MLSQWYTQTKSKACRGILFHDIPRSALCKEPDICLNRTQLVNYYNELVIQLRIAEHLVNISIIREIQEKYRTEVENKERKIIELLHHRILPLLHFVVSVITSYTYTILLHSQHYNHAITIYISTCAWWVQCV